VNDDEVTRPRTRGECHSIRRELGEGRLVPCPFMSCRHNLYVDKAGYRRLRVIREYDPDDLMPSCVLDVAENGQVEKSEITEIMGLSLRSIEYIEESGKRNMEKFLRTLEDFGDSRTE
jgi:hypothetical protein